MLVTETPYWPTPPFLFWIPFHLFGKISKTQIPLPLLKGGFDQLCLIKNNYGLFLWTQFNCLTASDSESHYEETDGFTFYH